MKTDKKIDDRRFEWETSLSRTSSRAPFLSVNPPTEADEFSFIKDKLRSFIFLPFRPLLLLRGGLRTGHGGRGRRDAHVQQVDARSVRYRAPLLLIAQKMTEIVDYANIPPVKGICTPLSIIAGSNEPPSEELRVTVVEDTDYENISLYVEEEKTDIDRSALSDGEWVFDPEETAALMNKLNDIGTPLEEYVEGHIYRGILTGLNEAFAPTGPLPADRKGSQQLKNTEALPLRKERKKVRHPDHQKYLVFLPKGITDK